MKIFILLISTIFIQSTEPRTNSIYGTWKLNKIEVGSTILQADEVKYLVTFGEGRISYNLEINTCSSNDVTIENNSIKIEKIIQTKICCDGRNDSLSNYINYSGSYIIKEDLLIITNSLSNKLYLSRYN